MLLLTAVYGVKGGNGVILITTKRGKEGKAAVHVKANATMKVVSKLPEKYEFLRYFPTPEQSGGARAEHQRRKSMGLSTSLWPSSTSIVILPILKNGTAILNVDWQKELFNNTAMSYNASVDVSGGTKLVKYFAAIDFAHEGDLFKDFTSGRGYQIRFRL